MAFSFIKPPSVIEWVMFSFTEPPSVIEWVFVMFLFYRAPEYLIGRYVFCAVAICELVILIKDDFGHQHIFLYIRLQAASLKTF